MGFAARGPESPAAPSRPFEQLVGDLVGASSRRLDVEHRLVDQTLDEERAVKVPRVASALLAACFARPRERAFRASRR